MKNFGIFLLFLAQGVCDEVNDALICNSTVNADLQWSVACINVKNVPENSFESPVFNLNLSRNLINTLNFTGWNTLRYLDLSYNKIISINENTFPDLTNLLVLDLSYNLITFLKEDSFKPLSRLKVLNLSGNHVMGPEFFIFSPAVKVALGQYLRELNLSFIGIRDIPDGLFETAWGLKKLDLSRNYLKELPRFPPFLETLDLSYNMIERLPSMAFASCPHLRFLLLENNINLVVIGDGAFQNLLNLVYLSIRNSVHIKALPSDTFFLKDKFERLSIAGCNFRTLPDKFKPALLSLKEVDLQNNPWVCDNSLLWIIELATPINSSESTRCLTPENVSVKEFFKPKPDHRAKRLLIASVLFLAIISLCAALYVGFKLEGIRKAKSRPYQPIVTYKNQVYVSTVT